MFVLLKVTHTKCAMLVPQAREQTIRIIVGVCGLQDYAVLTNKSHVETDMSSSKIIYFFRNEFGKLGKLSKSSKNVKLHITDN